MEWKEYNICQLCDTISETYKGKSNSVVLINTSDVLEGKVLNHKRVPNKGLKGQFKKTFKKNDILYSEIRPANKRFAYINFSPNDYIASTKLMVLRSKPIVSSYFLFQILKSEIVLKNLQMLAESRSGTFPQITYSELSNVRVKVPPLPVQDKIVGILSALDSKIENNNKINANLEAQAQALFKSWFVDFTPFKDQPFVDSELGPIPQGWKVGKLTDIAIFLNGLAMQKFPPQDIKDSFPVLKIKELGAGICDNSSDRCSNKVPKKYIIEDGDIIFSWSGTLMVDVWCGGQCGLNQHLFKVSSSNYPKWFYYHWTKKHLRDFIHIARDKAVTMGHIKRGHLDNALVVVPNNFILEKATHLFEPLLNMVISKRIENQRLAALRDTLLPKLMSGEIKL